MTIHRLGWRNTGTLVVAIGVVAASVSLYVWSGPGSQSQSGATGVTVPAPSDSHTAAAFATSDEVVAAVSAIDSELPGSLLVSASLASAAKSLNVSDSAAPTKPSSGSILELAARIPSAGAGAGILALWQADIVEGAIAQESRDEGGISVVGLHLTVELSDGTTEDTGTRLLPAKPANEVPGASSPDSDAALTDSYRSLASQYGLTVSSLSVVHAYGSAVEMVLTVPSLAAAAGNIGDFEGALADVAQGTTTGSFASISLPDGTVIAKMGTSIRNSSGNLWVASGLPVNLGTAQG